MPRSSEFEIVGVVEERAAKPEFIGLPVFADFDAVPKSFDAVLITDVIKPRETCDAALARFGHERVLIPELLRIRMKQPGEAAR